MPADPDKRKMREMKRAVKKRGNKHRRHALKRQLAENPEEAAVVEETFGRHSSVNFNGLDQDGTRKKDD